jgi:nitric oxide reductase subunit C
MASRVWVILFIIFIAFSWMVYAHCDDNNKEGFPDHQVNAGWKTWQARNCQSCHQLYGLGGYMGPDLTNIISEKGKGKDYTRVFILNGTARMPDFHLTGSEADELISFLTWVDKSGENKISADKVHWSGTYDLEKHN